MQPPVATQTFAGERIVQPPRIEDKADRVDRHLLYKLKDLRQRGGREYRQRIVVVLALTIVKPEARFALTNYLHHASVPASDGHRRRGFTDVNAGA